MAYWCGTCIPEARALAQLQQEYGDQLQVVVVDIDPLSTPERLQEFIFASTLGTDSLSWAMDRDGSFSRSYNIRALDTTIILDRDGREIYRDTYPTPYDTLRDELRKVL
jgi:thiol-disulfide isomerase/thioredoxin